MISFWWLVAYAVFAEVCGFFIARRAKARKWSEGYSTGYGRGLDAFREVLGDAEWRRALLVVRDRNIELGKRCRSLLSEIDKLKGGSL